jgi:hypothetical protein
MSDSTDLSSNETSTSDTPTGKTSTDDASTEGISGQRAHELRRMLFDLAYLTMQADGTEHLSEKTFVNRLARELEADVDAEERVDDLAPLLEQGPEFVRRRVLYLAAAVQDRAGDQADTITRKYLHILRDIIIADVDVAPEERSLFQDLCEAWNVDDISLPG